MPICTQAAPYYWYRSSGAIGRRLEAIFARGNSWLKTDSDGFYCGGLVAIFIRSGARLHPWTFVSDFCYPCAAAAAASTALPSPGKP